MVDISSQNNKINITVSSSGNTANTNITPDYAQYYSEKSKEWAISNKIVDNTDYSSKYYANESKKQADISTAKTTEVITSGNTAVSNIESARDNAIADIINRENLSVDNVNTAGITQVANVNSAGTTQVNLAKEQVTLATNQANIATNKASEVVASGKTALANITTAKNNAITSITNQETKSKNNIIATGNAQVERVNLTGVDNRTPIFSKNEIGTNEGVYQNVYDLKHSTFDKSKFTVVGNPTITDDGVASGFTTNSYLTIPAFTPGTKTWKINYRGSFKIIPGVQEYIYSFGVINNNALRGLRCFLNGDNGKLYLGLSFDGETITTITSSISLTHNIDYDIDVIFNGIKYTLLVDNIVVGELTSTETIYNNSTDYAYLGIYYFNKAMHGNLGGSIDLKQFSITVDGKEVFNGNKTGLDVINDIEIPYTLSKTGSKIVDVAYRDRVIDLYEQEGQAGYYTIDEPNKNFTLPMGEIYGMFESKADKVIVDEQLATKTDMLQASGAGMPSNKYIGLTLGASDSTYTAPANGWFGVYVEIAKNGQAMLLNSNETMGTSANWSLGGGSNSFLLLPVKKGNIVTYTYGSIYGKNKIYFIYAEGSK